MSRLPSEETQQVARANQRTMVRYRCAPATSGKLHFGGDGEYELAWIVNLSRHGIGATVTRPVPVGTFLIVQMRGTQGIMELPAQVIHSTRHSSSDWLLGCEMARPLSDEELESLL